MEKEVVNTKGESVNSAITKSWSMGASVSVSYQFGSLGTSVTASASKS